MRHREEEDGGRDADDGDGEETRFVGVAAEVGDDEHGRHVADVVDVLDEARHGAAQAELFLDLRDHRRVVAEAGRRFKVARC